MKVETKFNVGDFVWTIHDSRVICFTIKSIEITVFSNNDIWIKYIDNTPYYPNDHSNHKFSEGKCFASKEELAQVILNS